MDEFEQPSQDSHRPKGSGQCQKQGRLFLFLSVNDRDFCVDRTILIASPRLLVRSFPLTMAFFRCLVPATI